MSARMSSADTAWLHMDRPTNLMVINSVDLFDEPLDWDRVKEITQTRLVDRYPGSDSASSRAASRCAPLGGRTIRTSRSITTCITSRFPLRGPRPRSRSWSAI